MKQKDKSHTLALLEFRKEHLLKEMKRNLRVSKQIRDNPNASGRDRNEAIKNIMKMLGATYQDKPSPEEKKKVDKPQLKEKNAQELSLQEIQEIEGLIHAS